MRKIKNVILGLLIGCTAFAVTGVFGLTNENTAYAATDGVYNVRTDELIPDYASNGIDEKWEGNFPRIKQSITNARISKILWHT